MSVKELYFSNKNIINIANIICKTFNIANTDIKKFTSIKKIIITQMNLIYEKNKTKIIKVANIQKCIQKLNNVTYVKVNELLKKNNINIQKLPQKQKEKINNDTFNSIDDDLNNYAPVDSNSMENGFLKLRKKLCK